MNSLLIRFLVLGAFCLFTTGVVAQVQKWVDKDGKTHYGSRAPSSAKSIPVNNAPITSSLGVSQPDLLRSEQGSNQQGEQSLGVSEPNFRKSSRASTEVTKLYSTSWCGYCKKARAYMARNGIAYTEYDIERDRFAKSDYQAFRGRGVPLLVMGDKTLRGFRESSYDRFFKE